MKRRGALLMGLVALVGATLWLPAGPGRQAAAFCLLWLAPAAALAPRLRGPWSDRLLAASGLVLLGQALSHLVWHYLPGPMSVSGPVLATALFCLGLIILQGGDRPPQIPLTRRATAAFLILVLAAALRLGGLGYKEFQGDEGIIMTRAAAMITGDDAELFLHQKGPVEILLPLAPWLAGGRIDEFWARLPFTWASILAVAALMWLAWRWFGAAAGLAAGLLFAVNGFGVAFGHIVQYQSLVMLWGILAVGWADRSRLDERASDAADLAISAAFLAGALLAHYDALLFAPAVALAGWRGGRSLRASMGRWWPGALIALLLLLGFYGPYALSASFGRTGQYLLADRIGLGGEGGPLRWSGAAVWQMVTFYNGTWPLAGLTLLAGVGVVAAAIHALPAFPGGARRRRWGAAAVLAIVPLFVYLFVVADGRTHVYTFFPGVILLAGAGAATLGRRPPAARLFGSAALALGVGAGGLYAVLMFVDHTPERQRTWTENRPPGFPTTWREPPQFGLFGFPYQAGWRLAPTLLPAGATYASNEEEEITNWYMAQAPRTHCANDDAFFLAEDVQDPVALAPEQIAGKALRYRVQVNGVDRLRVYMTGAAAPVEVLEATGVSLFRSPAEVAPPRQGGDTSVSFTFGNLARLVGYDLDVSQARPGGQVVLTLYWEALAPFERNFQVFVQLFDGQMRGQLDTTPECGINPTTRWEPGQIVPDPHIVPIAADAPRAPIPVLVGMYDLITGDRLPVAETGADYVRLFNLPLSSP